MKLGLYGQQLTLMEELKAATFLPHARLQALPFFQALMACQLPLESYVGHLRSLSIVHGILEQALESSSDDRVASVWKDDMRKLPLLQYDLGFFEPRIVADVKDAVDAAIKIAERIRLRSIQEPVTLLGYLYVLEGSTLGAAVLRPQFARAFLLTGTDGLSYLGSYGTEIHVRWKQYQQRMNAIQLSLEEREQIVQAAGGFFTQTQAIFQALYPVKPDSMTYHVTSINPEAGRHPVPADTREVKASLHAADLCWQRFPYIEARYGERGRRFTRSDSAWLATLHQFDPVGISLQVRWLSRILSSRGMPTLLLQEQLEILFAELACAIPEKRPDYEKLLAAAAELRESRRMRISDEQLEALATDFDRAVGPEWSERMANTGALIAAAVADEKGGIADAVVNIKAWMMDASRFPSEWIQAVQTTLDSAQQIGELQ